MESHERSAPPDYGIMFNHDGTFHGKSEYPQRIDELLDKLYGPLQDTQVGAFITLAHGGTRGRARIAQRYG